MITCSLLRAHVVGRAHTEAGFGKPSTARDAECQCDPEVDHDRFAVLEQDVARFYVTVDDAVFMGVLERTGDLRGESHSLIYRKLLLSVDAVREVLPFDVGHHVEQKTSPPRPNRGAAEYAGESGSRWS